MSPPPDTRLRPLSFVLDGERVDVPAPPPTMTLLTWLREHAGRRGTKEGCAEGDCGACTVVLGETAPDGSLRWQAVNSCIRFLPTIAGKEGVTVEGLSRPGAEPHPVQRAMVENHASQCGFCTPGFVMSLFALYQENRSPDRADVIAALSGNLCRCTGYRPIIDAGLAMGRYPEAAAWSRDDAQSVARAMRLRAITDESGFRCDGFHAPRRLDDFAAAYAAAPQSLVLAGGTDIGLWATKDLRELPPLLYVGEVAELQQLRQDADTLWIGAAVTFSRAWPLLVSLFPGLAEQAERFASRPIRNSATLCGNLANGSPIGDSLPAMLALDAVLTLRRGDVTRRLPLADFYLDYRKNALAPGEFVVGVEVPLASRGDFVASYKISKRYEQDISAVSTTFRVRLDAAGVVREVRLAYGGMAGIAKRAAAAEAALLGRRFDIAAADAARAALASDFAPLTDLRATGAYRLEVAGNLIERFRRHVAGEDVSLPATPLVTGASR
jgi:xanthine dehydrogenase small subunit